MKNFFKTAWEIIKDFATNNWPMKIISLVFAFIVWCSVVAGTNPERIKVVENVPLQVEGVGGAGSKRAVHRFSAYRDT